MKKFIEIKRIFSGFVQRDILSIDRIDNIYIEYPEGTTIIIVRDDNKVYRECYYDYEHCVKRFNQLVRYLGASIHYVVPLKDPYPIDQDGEEDAEQDS